MLATPDWSSVACTVTLTKPGAETRVVSSSTDCTTGGCESQPSLTIDSLMLPINGLSPRTAVMLLALSCNWICSSCQSPQSALAGGVMSQFQVVEFSCTRHPNPTRANFEGLMKTPLTRFTPDLSSSATTKIVSRPPAFICWRSSHTCLSTGAVESERDDFT